MSDLLWLFDRIGGVFCSGGRRYMQRVIFGDYGGV